MDYISRSKWQVRVAALVIFLLGVAAGALAPRVYFAWRGHDGPPSREDRFERMLERLQLSPEQKTEVQQILGDSREQLRELRHEAEPRMKEIQQQTDERLQKVLTPEQFAKFQQMTEEMRARGRRGRGKRGGGGDPPPVKEP